jgi:hypothetical protein
LALLWLALPGVAQASPSLAIVGVESPPYMVGLADEITRMATDAARPSFNVQEAAKTRATLGEATLEKLATCPDAACRTQIVAPLGAELAFGGTLSQNETSYVVSLWLLDVRGKKIVAQLDRSILIASRRLEADLGEAIPKMLAGKAEGGGEIVVHSVPEATMVEVDDSPIGGGSDVHKTVEPGKHRVVIQAEGYLPIERWVQVAADQVVRLNERLIPVGGHMEEATPEKEAAKTKKEKASEGEGHGFSLPVATWVSLAVSAAAFGTGLYFGVTANNFDHMAGQLDASGVDQGLTRAQAVQGQTDAAVANYMYIGAGALLAVAIVVAIVTPSGSSAAAPSSAPASNASPVPAALHWSFP